MIVTSRYVVPVDRPVIEDGAVEIDHGRIAAVGPAHTLPQGDAVHYGDAVICPGFVNAHTHLELSSCGGQVPTSPDFIGWLTRLMSLPAVESPTREHVQQALGLGIRSSLAHGVTMLGDITRHPQWTREILAASAARGVSFGEVVAIGRRRQLLAERLDAAAAVTWQTARLRIGISPHAPYTVEPDALRSCASRGRDMNAPLAIHLAETTDEETFTQFLEGRFVEYLTELGVWDDVVPRSNCSPVELAEKTGVLGKGTLIAHANYVTERDLERIARSGAGVAYCPRTHHAFGHPPHRFRDMLAAGINVCFGTDSLASNPSLSILEELRFLRRVHPDLSAELLMAMGTLHGARALGFGETAGSLTVGKLADLVVIPVAASSGGWAAILEGAQPPAAVYAEGVLQRKDGVEAPA